MSRFAPALMVLLVTLGACSWVFRRDSGPPRDEIRAAHGPHIRAGLGCLTCHEGVVPPEEGAEPAKLAGAERRRPLLPTEAQCKACHNERPEEQQCGFCHTQPEIAGTYPAHDGEIIFEHTEHVTRASGLCVRCHLSETGDEGTSTATYEPRRQPPMNTCTDACHTHSGEMRGMECSRCHRNLHRYGISEVAIVRHRPGFNRRHGSAARVDGELCGQCHDATHCAECHQASPGLPPEVIDPTRVATDFIHRGDFLARHPIEARVMQGTCTRCHGIGFCDGCHRESGVGGSVAPGSPHDPGWLTPLSPRGHSRAARRDILSCAACHESNANQTCVPCHRVGGVAAMNPHPPNFGGGMDPQRHAVCLVCHEEWP